MTYTDCHCHLADLRFSKNLDQVIERAQAQGIATFIQGGVDPEDWERQKELQRKFGDKILTSFGLHPQWVAQSSEAEFENAFHILKAEISEANALGEIGLDHRTTVRIPAESKAFQARAFRLQLELLGSSSKPVVLHIVRAHGEAISILEEFKGLLKGGIVHSFSGNRENAKKYLDLGLSLSISGSVARPGFESLKKAVAYIPIDRLLVETDSPDQSMDGSSLNEPTALIETARVLSEFRKTENAEQILRASALNAEKIFR